MSDSKVKTKLKTLLRTPWFSVISKVWHTILGKPYFKVTMVDIGNGQIGIDAQYNIHFIYQLDNLYSRTGSVTYQRDLEEEHKITIYLYDSINQVADEYGIRDEPEVEFGDDIMEGIPMAVRGGEEVKQVVDIATMDRSGNNSRLDIEMG